jgi:hypothetical protein
MCMSLPRCVHEALETESARDSKLLVSGNAIVDTRSRQSASVYRAGLSESLVQRFQAWRRVQSQLWCCGAVACAAMLHVVLFACFVPSFVNVPHFGTVPFFCNEICNEESR